MRRAQRVASRSSPLPIGTATKLRHARQIGMSWTFSSSRAASSAASSVVMAFFSLTPAGKQGKHHGCETSLCRWCVNHQPVAARSDNLITSETTDRHRSSPSFLRDARRRRDTRRDGLPLPGPSKTRRSGRPAPRRTRRRIPPGGISDAPSVRGFRNERRDQTGWGARSASWLRHMGGWTAG